MTIPYRHLSESQKDQHPSIPWHGSITGMKKLGYWGKNDIIVRCDGCYYNMSIYIRSYPRRFA